MNDIFTSTCRKAVSIALTTALLLTAPGLGCYDALAAVVGMRAATQVQAVPGGAAGAGLSTLSPMSANGGSLLTPARAGLTGSLPTLRQLAVTPAASRSQGINAGVRADAVSPLLKARASQAPGGIAASRAFSKSPSLKKLLSDPKRVALSASEAGEMTGAQAHVAGRTIMDRILGLRSITGSKDAVAVPSASSQLQDMGLRLRKGAGLANGSASSKAPASPVNQVAAAPQARTGLGKAVGFFKSLAVMAVSGGAVFGLHALAAALLPTVFGTVPVVAVWAVSSGVILLPAALYARYRMGKRDSPRLTKVKLLYDVLLGAFLGASFLGLTQVFGGAILTDMTLTLPILAGGAAVTALATRSMGESGGFFDKILAWMSLNLLTPLIGAVTAAPLTLGGFLGLAALPAITTIAFFLGRIISSAETGRPFSIPGSVQQIRFPAYTWVMTGVVFALLTGYSPVWTNAAFALWMFLGKTRIFNYLYGAAAVWTIFSGFSVPLTFLVLAFAPERAAILTEYILGRILKRGAPAPSGSVGTSAFKEARTDRWPKFHYVLKTGLAIGSLLTLGTVMSAAVFQFSSFAVNFGIAAALSLLPLIFSKWLIKKTMRATPMNERDDPETFGIMRELRERINADRAAKGKKPIPMPEMVNVPMPVPNAFATGRSPFSAMVGVTHEMKDMTLNPRRTRQLLVRLIHSVDPQSKAFLAYRKAIRGSIAGIDPEAGPLEIVQALESADPAQVKALGVRALRGVMGHEFTHVMHRDMLLGAVAGTLASAIAFSSYGVLWAVGHAQALMAKLWEKLTGRRAAPAPEASRSDETFQTEDGADAADTAAPESYKRQAFEPITTTAAATSLLGLVKIFAALWGPVIATLLSMASSRTREGHADEGGAILTEDAESLALGLGLLTSWRPPMGMFVHRRLLPLIAAQAHIMTVNPIEQLYRANALPKMGVLARMAVGKEDNFFFNLFITHPDTNQRIERLYDMSEAMKTRKEAGKTD